MVGGWTGWLFGMGLEGAGVDRVKRAKPIRVSAVLGQTGAKQPIQ